MTGETCEHCGAYNRRRSPDDYVCQFCGAWLPSYYPAVGEWHNMTGDEVRAKLVELREQRQTTKEEVRIDRL